VPDRAVHPLSRFVSMQEFDEEGPREVDVRVSAGSLGTNLTVQMPQLPWRLAPAPKRGEAAQWRLGSWSGSRRW
jgi:hypothetical protein